MGTTLAARDKTTLDLEGRLFALDLDSERVTVREIIRSRVYQEVDEYNARQPEYFRGLVQPTGAEKTLDGYKLRKKRRIDAEKQFHVALDAFRDHGFLMLVDNHQVTDLDQVIEVQPDTTVTFFKLIPLAGG
jgi:hypothetical protein